MKITFDIGLDKIAELLRTDVVVSDPELHLSIVEAVADSGGAYYKNATGIGPSRIPMDMVCETLTLKDHIDKGTIIQAIKGVRARYGLGLRESKAIVDSIRASL